MCVREQHAKSSNINDHRVASPMLQPLDYQATHNMSPMTTTTLALALTKCTIGKQKICAQSTVPGHPTILQESTVPRHFHLVPLCA